MFLAFWSCCLVSVTISYTVVIACWFLTRESAKLNWGLSEGVVLRVVVCPFSCKSNIRFRCDAQRKFLEGDRCTKRWEAQNFTCFYCIRSLLVHVGTYVVLFWNFAVRTRPIELSHTRQVSKSGNLKFIGLSFNMHVVVCITWLYNDLRFQKQNGKCMYSRFSRDVTAAMLVYRSTA